MSYPVVLSFVQAEVLLAAKRQGQASIEVSPDLGISTITARYYKKGYTSQQANR